MHTISVKFMIDQAEAVHKEHQDKGFSKDAILLAIALGGRRAMKPVATPQEEDLPPPVWLLEACERLKGQRLQIQQLLFLCGQPRGGKRQANQVAKWLRSLGRYPKKAGGVTGYVL